MSQNTGFAMQLSQVLQALLPAVTSLRILDVSDCKLYGKIPDTIWSFTNLIQVTVGNNFLSGQLPLPVDNMQFLITLDFSKNNLSGDIPDIYAELLGLQTFDVSGNPRLVHGKGDSSKIPRFARTDNGTMIREGKKNHFTCPEIRFKHNRMDSTYYDRVYCECDYDFYGTNGRCLPCMSGGLSTWPDQSFMQITSGYWPSPSPDNATHLVSCNATWKLCSPTGECNCSASSTTAGHLFTFCNPECVCSKGSSGRYCSKCERNYYSHGGFCHECPSKDADKLQILLPVILLGLLTTALVIWLVYFREKRKWSIAVVVIQVLIVSILHVFSYVPFWLLEINVMVLLFTVVGRGRQARGILKIDLFYFQLLDAMTSNFILLPLSVLKAQRYFSNILNFRFEGLECYFPNQLTPVGKFSSLLLLPFGVLLVTILVYLVIFTVCKILNYDGDFVKNARNFCLNVIIVFLNLTYFPIVKRAFSALLPCKKDYDLRYMATNPWIDCSSEEHKIMIILGYSSLALYGLCVPFALFLPLLLWAFVCRTARAEQPNETDSWLGSMYLAYKMEYRSFIEICYLIRRALFAAVLSFTSYGSSFQTSLLTVGFLISLLLSLTYKPYECPSTLRIRDIEIDVENSIENLNLVVLLFSFIALGQEYVPISDMETAKLLWVMVLAGNCIATVVCVVGTVARLVSRDEQRNLDNADRPEEENSEDEELLQI